jgi:chitinase
MFSQCDPTSLICRFIPAFSDGLLEGSTWLSTLEDTIMSLRSFASVLALSALGLFQTHAFDNTCNSNLAVYWGQNSYGATHTDTANFQKTLSYYCQDDSIDVIPIAFLDVYFGTGGMPDINLSNICNPTDSGVFPGTGLAKCQFLEADIKACQAKGKIITLSLGGATGGGSFSSDSQARQFADTIWNLFLGGSSSTRPFGNTALDGVDLDIEGGTSSYVPFVEQLRSHFNGASKKYYVTAAPQCVFPDAALGNTLNNAYFDAIYVQFYNNPCGLQTYPNAQTWNFGNWDYWARNVSPNKNIKVYIGAPAAQLAAGSGYVSLQQLQTIAQGTRKAFPSFGGVMFWDASQAYANGRYDAGTKAFLKNGGSCGGGFIYPACSAPAWSASGNYPAGSQVSYNGYIWQAKWYASGTPNGLDATGSWVPISACGGTSTTPPPTSTTTTTTTTSTPPTTTTTTTKPPAGCSGVAAWSSSIAYTGGQQVSYGGHLWQAKWWTQADTPGGAAGVWTDLGPCFAGAAATQAPAAHTSIAKAPQPAVGKNATVAGHGSAAPVVKSEQAKASPETKIIPGAKFRF